jgi:hypothetical protein
VINSPFTRWEGDDIHGRRPVLTSVWVNLDVLFPRPADAPRHVIVIGLDLTGVVPGRLHGRFPSVEGDWYGSSTTRSATPTAAATSSTWLTSSYRSPRCANGNSGAGSAPLAVEFTPYE